VRQLPLPDLVVLLLYVLGVVGMGLYFARKSRSPEGFTAADRSLPGWVVGLSIFGTFVSSISFLALPGKAFIANWNSFVFSLSLPVAAWIGTRYFVPFYRKGGAVSAYHHLEERFGPWARAYAAACYLLTQMARMGSILFLLALPLNQLLGWDLRLIILGTGCLTTLFTLAGGIRAVIWTDAVQSVVLILGALLCAVLIPLEIPGGLPALVDIAREHEKFSLGSFGLGLADATFWVVLVYGLFINLQNFGIDQGYVQRYLTARTDAEARKSLWLGALLYVPVSLFFFWIGAALFAYYTAQPHLLPEAIQADVAAGKGDGVFPFFIVDRLPAGVTGLLIAAIFAAAVSTLSTSLNSAATLTLADFYRRYVRPDAGERESMRVLYAGTLAWGVVGTTTALAMIRVQSVLDAWWQLAGVFSGGMLGLFLLGILSRRAGSAAALAGALVGVAVILWMTLSPKWEAVPPPLRSPFHGFLTIVFGTLAILLVGFLASLLLTRKKKGA
jgi:solute:Na+ symporter, SSS family